MRADVFWKAPAFQVVVQMKPIRASYAGNRKDTTEVIDLFHRGLISVPFKVIGLSKLQEVYDLVRKSSSPFKPAHKLSDVA